MRGIPFEGRRVALKGQVAAFFEVTERTIDDYISAHGGELARNGYEVIRGKRLKSLKESIQQQQLDELNFVEFKHTPQLGVFDFRAFLNLAMLLAERTNTSHNATAASLHVRACGPARMSSRRNHGVRSDR